jgi:preprotein translocase SecE subunit
VARTRQKAKQRQAKRRAEQSEAQGTTGQKPPSNPAEEAAVRQAEAYEVADVLEESGGDVEEAVERLEDELSDEAVAPVEAPEPMEAPEPAEAAPSRRSRRRKEAPERQAGDGRGGRDGGGRDRGGRGRGGGPRQQRPEPRREARQRNRVINFFIQVWAELRRVQWPDRNQVSQATGVVVVFCLIAGLYLAFFDWAFAELVKAIL